MPQPSKIPLAFAASGDKNTIPENTETTGLASWRDGFPAITSAPFSEGGIAPKRADFNGIFNALSQAIMWLQQGGVYAYDVTTDYEAGNVVFDAGGLYVANSANGPSSAVVQPSSDTTGATWKPVRLDLATQSAAGYMSAADKAALDNVPMTYLPATTISSGVWTPVLRGGTTAGVMTYTTQRGQYVKVGNLVFVWGEVNGTFTTLPAGEVQIAGLPFSAGTTRQCSINAYGRNGGVSNSVNRLVKAVAYLNYMILQANAAADTAASGVGKVDYAVWDTSSNSGYRIYITSENNGARIYFAGVYSV